MSEYLKKGYMLHFSGAGDCPYPSTNGHYVGIFSMDNDGNVKIANSGFSSCPDEMKLEDVVNAGYHGDAFSAIKRKGSSNKHCTSDKCANSDDSSTNKEGFKDAATADQKIMAPYRELYNASAAGWAR